jgi:hypothetical protein
MRLCSCKATAAAARTCLWLNMEHPKRKQSASAGMLLKKGARHAEVLLVRYICSLMLVCSLPHQVLHLATALVGMRMHDCASSNAARPPMWSSIELRNFALGWVLFTVSIVLGGTRSVSECRFLNGSRSARIARRTARPEGPLQGASTSLEWCVACILLV